MKEKIISYLVKKYNPEAIITYGSYADGSANEYSDFDALIIARSSVKHDSSIVCNTVLDVFVYSPDVFKTKYNPEEFVQIFDGKIELDKRGNAKNLKDKVLQYIEEKPIKTREEIHQEIEWCKKMLLRTSRGDAEGYFRWHWLLEDSLEIYFDVVKQKYFGPKKALRQMKKHDPKSYEIYENALKNFQQETLSAWIKRLETLSL